MHNIVTPINIGKPLNAKEEYISIQALEFISNLFLLYKFFKARAYIKQLKRLKLNL
mgnify:FL=1